MMLSSDNWMNFIFECYQTTVANPVYVLAILTDETATVCGFWQVCGWLCVFCPCR